MRKVKGGDIGKIEDGKYFKTTTIPMLPTKTSMTKNPFNEINNNVEYEKWNMPGYVDPSMKIKGVGLKKVSAAAKAKMAKLRAMRKGGDIWGDFVGAVSHVGDQIVSGATDVGNQIAKGATDVGNQVANGATNLVNKIGDDLRGAADNVVSFYQQAASTASPLVNAAIAEVAKNLPSDADAKALGKQLASALIHQGIPQATAAICAALCEAAFPEGGPVSAQLGSQVGKMLGDKIADEVGNQTGYGLGKRRGYRQLLRGGTLHKGVPYPHYTDRTLERIRTHGLDFRHKGENGMYKGGSFAPLGGSVC
jgi:hypothetical protein